MAAKKRRSRDPSRASRRSREKRYCGVGWEVESWRRTVVSQLRTTVGSGWVVVLPPSNWKATKCWPSGVVSKEVYGARISILDSRAVWECRPGKRFPARRRRRREPRRCGERKARDRFWTRGARRRRRWRFATYRRTRERARHRFAKRRTPRN